MNNRTMFSAQQTRIVFAHFCNSFERKTNVYYDGIYTCHVFTSRIQLVIGKPIRIIHTNTNIVNFKMINIHIHANQAFAVRKKNVLHTDPCIKRIKCSAVKFPEAGTLRRILLIISVSDLRLFLNCCLSS